MSKSVSEVEEILREIRLRVQDENLVSTQIARRAAERSPVDLAPAEPPVRVERPDAPVDLLDISHLQARLNTLDKTRNNLPPIVSHRSGLVARTELFVKRQIKRMTKWFTWDQLTFNTAVYETLVEQQKILLSTAHELSATAQELAATAQELAAIAREQARLRELFTEAVEKQRSDASAEIEDMRTDLLQRLVRLEDQQSVIYKNLLLQMRETTAVADQSRRSVEERMAAFENEMRSS